MFYERGVINTCRIQTDKVEALKVYLSKLKILPESPISRHIEDYHEFTFSSMHNGWEIDYGIAVESFPKVDFMRTMYYLAKYLSDGMMVFVIDEYDGIEILCYAIRNNKLYNADIVETITTEVAINGEGDMGHIDTELFGGNIDVRQ